MQNPVVVMRVLRMPPMGKLVVEVNKNRFEKWNEIEDENVQRLLLAAIGELIVFADGYDNLVAAGVAPPLATVTSEEPARPLEERQAEFLTSLEAEKASVSATPKPTSFIKRAARQPGTQHVGSVSESPSVVAQIDAILQRHLVTNPELAEHDIHLRQDASGGLRIVVDDISYQSPKEIEDPSIQKVIKRALQEWERS